MTNTEINFDFIKAWLEHGEIRKLAIDYGIHPTTGYLILNQERKNYGFVEVCYKRALERYADFAAFEQQRKTLSEKIAAI